MKHVVIVGGGFAGLNCARSHNVIIPVTLDRKV
jgi:NADH dehydrogenase FAD-containing subunit